MNRRPPPMIFTMLLLCGWFGCEQTNTSNQRQSIRPSEDDEPIAGYLESTEIDVATDSETILSAGNSSIQFPKNSSAVDYRARISILKAPPQLTDAEALIIGEPEADIVEIELYDPATGRILSSDEILEPYVLRQKSNHAVDPAGLGMMAITDPGTDLEYRSLLSNSELEFDNTAGLKLRTDSSFTVRSNLRVTTGIFWLVNFDATLNDQIPFSTSESLKSYGGIYSKNATQESGSFSEAAIVINEKDAFTRSSTVSLELTAPNAAEMYLTENFGCLSGGSYEAFKSTTNFELSKTNRVVRVYAKYRTATGEESPCLSDSITHDDIAPSSPTDFASGVEHTSTSSTPNLTWKASTDAGSGLSHYEVAIGSSRDSMDIKSWTNVGKNLSATIDELNLSSGSRYYARLRASDMAGNLSSEVTTDWLVVPAQGSAHTIFITDADLTGNFLNSTSPDSICNTEATNASLSGTFVAMYSTPALSLRSKITISGPVRLTDGTQIASNASDLWDGTIAHPINRTALNQQVGGIYVWTGSTSEGNTLDNGNCNGWTSAAGTDNGSTGYSAATDFNWLDVSNAGVNAPTPCNSSGHFYCISQ